MNNNALFTLTPEEFEQLQQTGTLYKLFPSAPINVQVFKKQQEDYHLHEWAYELIDEFCQRTGADPLDVVDIIRKHKDTLFAILKGDDNVNWEEIIEAIREEDE